MKAFRIAASLVLVTNSLALAWGPQGHMMVAAVAWKKLNASTRLKVVALLKLNPNYEDWVRDAPAADADQIAFVTAATWPDFIKSAAGYRNDGEHPSGPDAANNIGYDDKLQHRYWHFYDTPFSPDGTATVGPDSVNALTQIRMFTRALRTSSDDSVQSYDLVWLEHMVGDVHQPLHATSRFDEEDPQGDEGANRVLLCSPSQAGGDPKKCRSNLHSFWDDVPGSGESATAAIARANSLAAADATKAADANPADWINESFVLAKAWVYVDPIKVGDGPFVLTASYRSTAKSTADAQIALAGARLANLLNTAIGSH